MISNSRDVGQDIAGPNVTEILSLTAAKQETLVDAVQGIVKFAKEFLDLIDAADATGQSDIAREALKRLAAAGAVKGALQGRELRGLALRLANHGELTRLGVLVNNLIAAGQGRESAFAAAVLGDNTLMEKAWQETGMLAEAVLHAHAHGRPTLKSLVESWNKMLQKELEHGPNTMTDATAAFLASLEEPKLSSLGEAPKKPPIEVLPPGMPSLAATMAMKKKPATGMQGLLQQPNKPLALEAPPSSNTSTTGANSIQPEQITTDSTSPSSTVADTGTSQQPRESNVESNQQPAPSPQATESTSSQPPADQTPPPSDPEPSPVSVPTSREETTT